MKTFKYTARNANGATIDGIVEANSADEAVIKLKDDGLLVSDIEQSDSSHDISFNFGKKYKEKDLSLICRQLSIIMAAGLPAVRSIRLVAEQATSKHLNTLLNDVADDLAAGRGMADSFEKHGKGLPTTFVETIRAGEDSGNLETVFDRLADYYDKSSKTKSKISSAMIYPAFVVGIAIIVIIVIMVFAVPVFSSTFINMGIEMPWITQLLIDSSNFMSSNGLLLLAIVVIAILAFRAALRNPAFHLKASRLMLRMPIIGRVITMNVSSQFASTMSVMQAAGLSVVASARAAGKVLSNYYMSHKLEETIPDLEAGKQLSTSLKKTEAFPPLVVEMTGVGEETGSLEGTLNILSDYYDNESEVITQRALSIMEPVIIVILAVMVGGILLAVYLPVFSLYGGFSG